MSDAARKIAVIVALDVAGYSARTEADEAKTTAEVAALRKVIESIAKAHGGRVFNTAGDGFMLEFASSLAAVEAAGDLAAKCEPKVRVGVHLGDVVVQPNGDLLGHGVNVAARLMAKSDPGSALISADVRRTIRGPLAERLVSRGLMQLDKMAETIEAFSFGAKGRALAPATAKPVDTRLAVLPFENLSSDAEMQFFSDGVSEDILGRIQRGSKLTVIGRTSSFQFRGRDKPKAAAALKATHVLDGSIRRGGNKVRITANLTEAATQTTVWSNKYDRSLGDIFAVQDEISEAIAAALSATLFSVRKAAIDPAAYDLFLRGRAWTPDPAQRAASVATLEAVTHLAPTFADAWGHLAIQRALASFDLPYEQRKTAKDHAKAAIDRCIELDPANPLAAHAQFNLFDPFGAHLSQQTSAELILARSASSVDALTTVAYHLYSVGRNREGFERAHQTRDLDPLSDLAQTSYGYGFWCTGHFAEGRAAMEASVQSSPNNHHAVGQLIVACALQQDWVSVDALIDPARLAKYPLREFRAIVGLVAVMRDPTPENRRLLWDTIRGRIETTGHADATMLIWPAHFGFVNESYELLDKVKLGPSGGKGDILGASAYRTQMLFLVAVPELRADPRFVKLCARLGLVEYWLATQKWPDCAEVVPYDFRAECEKYRDCAKDKFFK